MSTAPIINISNLGGNTAAATKAGNQATSPDQSFGQVLSREVGRNNADGDSNNSAGTNSVNGNGNVAPTATPAPAASSSPSATDGKTAKTKTGDKSSETADSSANTNASTSPTTNTDAASASASTQLLALVNNVQQNTASSKGDASVAAGAIPGSSSIGSAADLAAQAALGNFQAAAAASVGKTADLSTRVIDNASTTVATPQDLEAELKNIKLTDSSTAPAAKNAAAESVIEKQNASYTPAGAPAATLDLSAAAEKNLQAGLAALDANAVKIEQTSQTAPAVLPSANAQQAMLNLQALPGNANDEITPQVGNTGWDQAVGQKVVWMVAGGQQNASLTLNPPDLGPMQVVLNVTNSHATVTFTAAQPEVRQALETAMPKLREMLGDAGIQLGQASINSGSAQQQNMASQQGSHNSVRSADTGGAAETTITAARSVATSAGLGMVDTFA